MTAMDVVVVTSLSLVLIAAVAVVANPDPRPQAVTLSIFGLALTVLFLVLQAPDVALSELAVGTVFIPLMVLLAVSKIRGGR